MNGKKARRIRKEHGVKHARLARQIPPIEKVEEPRREPTTLDRVAK